MLICALAGNDETVEPPQKSCPNNMFSCVCNRLKCVIVCWPAWELSCSLAGGRLEAGWRQAGARMEPDIAVWATFSTMRLYMAFFCGEVGGQDGATRWSSRVKAQSQATGTSMQAKLTIFIIIIDVLASLDGEPCAQGGPG